MSAELKKIKAKRLSDLQEKLRSLEKARSINKDSSTLEQMRPVKQEIDKILSEEIEKKLKYLKQRYYEAGPKALENSKLKLQFIKLGTPKQTKSPQNWRASKKPLRHITNHYTHNQTRQTD